MGTASLSVGLTLLFLEEPLSLVTGGGGSFSSLSPATEGEEAGDMGGIAEEFLSSSTGGGDDLSSLSPATEGEEAEDMGGKVAEDVATASLSVGLVLLVEEFLLLSCAGGDDSFSSLSPATEGEAEDVGSKEGGETKDGSGKEGGEADGVGGKVAEEVATASLSAGPTLLVEESLFLFCAGGGDPLSSLSPAADSTEAGNMVGKVADDVSRASLSVIPRMAKR